MWWDILMCVSFFVAGGCIGIAAMSVLCAGAKADLWDEAYAAGVQAVIKEQSKAGFQTRRQKRDD